MDDGRTRSPSGQKRVLPRLMTPVSVEATLRCREPCANPCYVAKQYPPVKVHNTIKDKK